MGASGLFICFLGVGTGGPVTVWDSQAALGV